MLTTTPPETSRFARLLSPVGPKAPWDTPVLETERYVVVPTLGSILPGWLLVIPRAHNLSFAQLSRASGENPIDVVRSVTNRIGCDNWIWFEHGAAEQNTSVGCGVDYAHLHVLLEPHFCVDEFESATAQLSGRSWEPGQAESVYRALAPNVPYHVFGNGEAAWSLSGPDLGSQFFRRVVAAQVGRPSEWNYRDQSGIQNVLKTLSRFEHLGVAAE